MSNNYKDIEVVTLTLERYEKLKRNEDRLSELLSFVSNSGKIDKDTSTLILNKAKLKQAFQKLGEFTFGAFLGSPYDFINDIKFKDDTEKI